MMFQLRSVGGDRRRSRRMNFLEQGLKGPVFEACEPRLLLTAFLVTTAADSGPGSLREAITLANTSGGADTISFNIAGGGAHTINLLSNLPAIAAGDGAVILDATTQPGYAGSPLIALNGTGLGGNGLILFSGNSTIKGLAIHSFGARGIFIGLNGGNTIEANYIGTDLTGSIDLGNATDGIVVNVVGNNIIQNNVISGNNDEGIQFTGSTTGNIVQGNRIGTNGAGTADLGNTNSGITFDAAGNDNNQVLNNLISGNGLAGITIGSSSITVRGNLIGTDITGTLAIPNSEDGITIASGASNNIIGGSLPGQGNTIAFNTRDGVRVLTGTGNRISGNSMFANGTLGIDLIPVLPGVTPNDLNDGDGGPNLQQNFPVITFAASNGFTTNVSGTLNSTPGGTFTIEFFSNAPGDLDASGHGEGRVFLGSTVVTDGDADGNISFAAVLTSGAAIGDVITATATNAAGNTSEFSAHNFGAGGTTVVPSNLPPTADAGGPYAVAEGGFVLLDASGSSDPDQPTATLDFAWDFDGDLDFDDAFGMNPVFFAAGLDGFVGSSVTVAVRVTDNGLLTSTDTATITIDNVAPTLSNVAVTSADEGGTVTLTGDITDPGTPDAFTLTIDWGNGVEVINLAPGTTSFSIDRAYADDDPTGTASDNYNIQLTLEDDDGGVDTDSTVTTISNVAPVLSNLAVTNANEGGSVTLTGDIADPGEDDPITLTIDWGDGVEVINLAPGTTSFSVDHTYLDDNPTGTPSDNISINVTVEDDDLGSDGDSVITIISNVAPVVATINGPTLAVPGQLLNYSSSFTDAGTLDTHTLQWEIKNSSNVVVASGGGLSIDFTPTAIDTYTVSFTVTDDDTGSDTETLNLTVTGAVVAADPANPGDTALFVGGTTDNDIIELTKPSDGNVKVRIRNGNTLALIYQDTFSTAGIDRFVITGLDGNDIISVASNLPSSIQAEIYGNDGNDLISGGSGNDYIDGGDGLDIIFGANGRDILVGGLGFDIVTGNVHDDILIGGVYTGGRETLAPLFAEWTSGNNYNTRVNNLKNGGGLNGSFVLNQTTVFDDAVADILLGLQGRDWFLSDVEDDITDKAVNEVLTDIEIDFFGL